MATVRSARVKLAYPLYGADFDPLNNDFLIVGGGGGSTSSGVPNKITLIDASRRDQLREVLDLDLSKHEDSVTSLAVATSNESSLTAYAGINASQRDQEAGKNEHLRSFRIALPAKKRTAAGQEKSEAEPSASSKSVESQALSRTALFRSAMGSKNDTYQRVLRVAPAHAEGGERVGAIASGLAPQSEVITFRATSSPSTSNVISRINLEKAEAADLDIMPVEDQSKSHALAYCTDYDVYLQHIPSGGKQPAEPIKVYSTARGPTQKKIRCLRWLNSRYLVILRNFAGRTGCDIEVLKTDKEYTQVVPTLVKKLSRSTKSAVGLDVCTLPAASTNEQQFIFAVAGQDCSIEILTANFHPSAGMQKMKQYSHIRDVHASPITKLAFSKVPGPRPPVSKDTPPQYARLASVGVDQVVVVHTLPLRPYPATSRIPRYVLVTPPEFVQNLINIFVAILVVGVTALCMQIFCEIRGALPPVLGAPDWLPLSWQARIVHPYDSGRAATKNAFNHIRASGPVIPDSMPPVIQTASSSLNDAAESIKSAGEAAASIAVDTSGTLLSSLVDSPESDDKVIVIRDTPADPPSNPPSDKDNKNPIINDDQSPEPSLLTELHDQTADTPKTLKDETVKKWEDLTEKEKKGWRKKLIDAGHWTEKEGEKVLKGIFFGELAGVVGAAMRG